jgi:hypothetical protein
MRCAPLAGAPVRSRDRGSVTHLEAHDDGLAELLDMGEHERTL